MNIHKLFFLQIVDAEQLYIFKLPKLTVKSNTYSKVIFRGEILALTSGVQQKD